MKRKLVPAWLEEIGPAVPWLLTGLIVGVALEALLAEALRALRGSGLDVVVLLAVVLVVTPFALAAWRAVQDRVTGRGPH